MAMSPEQQRQINVAFKYSAVGIEMAACVAAGTFGGTWLDKKFGTGVFIYLAVFLGAATAFYSMYRQLMANLEREEAAKRARKAGGNSASGGPR